MTDISQERAARFWAKVEKRGSGECWPWMASGNGKGYGSFWDGDRTVYAHRFVYELEVGPIPAGHVIDHVKERGCTRRDCVNPAHLEAITNRENVLRGEGASAQHARKTHCRKGHALAGTNVYRAPAEPNKRRCRRCDRERHKAEKKHREVNADKRREHERAHRKRHPEKINARRAVRNAVGGGKIIKPDNCEDCGRPVAKHLLQGHHEDYSKPLDVDWLCGDCHSVRHRKEQAALATLNPNEGEDDGES